jgi:hypothetical protein
MKPTPFDSCASFGHCSWCGENDKRLRVISVRLRAMGTLYFHTALCPDCFPDFITQHFDEISEVFNMGCTNIGKSPLKKWG